MSIFEKVKLRPSQLRTVAYRRYDDAEALYKLRQNARANGAMYLGGFVIECMLKAKLMERFGWLQSTRSPDELDSTDQRIWSLCYRSHDLDEILNHLPGIIERLTRQGRRESNRLIQSLKRICAEWTIFARYSPRTADTDDARDFLRRVRELRTWLT